MYKKAYAAVKPKETQYVVAKKFTANARAKRPAGCKGPYKQVDIAYVRASVLEWHRTNLQN